MARDGVESGRGQLLSRERVEGRWQLSCALTSFLFLFSFLLDSSECSKRNSGSLSSQGTLKEFPFISEGLDGKWRAEEDSLPEGVRGSFGEARGIEGEEEREEQYQQILALLRGRARGSISS